jgi:spore maturation protein CgeB
MNAIVYRYKSICEPDFIDAFKAVGLNITENLDSTNKSLSLDDRIARLGEQIADTKPLFIFSINFFPFVAMVCERLKILYVCVTVDCPVLEIYNNAIKSPYNRVFLFDKKQYESVKDSNPNCIFHLPLGAAVDRVSALLSNTAGYDYDISFVGSMYNEKDPYSSLTLPEHIKKSLEEKMQQQLEDCCYGLEFFESAVTEEEVSAIKTADPDFYPSTLSIRNMDRQIAIDDYISPHITVLERFELLNALAKGVSDHKTQLFTGSITKGLSPNIRIGGRVNSLTEMPYVFRKSRININTTMRAIRSGLPQRIWDVLACGGFLLTNNQPEIEELFTPGVHLETFSSKEELVDKANYYLTHEEQREKIVLKGYEKVCAEDTVLHRIMAIIKTIMESIS